MQDGPFSALHESWGAVLPLLRTSRLAKEVGSRF